MEKQIKVKAKDNSNQLIRSTLSYVGRFSLFAVAVYIGTKRR